jgi:putative membrane protein
MKSKAIIIVSSVLAVAACGQKNDAANSDVNVAADNSVATNAAVESSPLTSQAFANAAAASDNFEIESSKLAATSAQSAAVKSFAAKMIAAHTASTAKLKAAAASLSPAVTPDNTLSSDQQQKLDNLKSLHGADFDTAYASAQVAAHQAALDALKGYAASGDNATLQNLAKGMIPTVTAHLNMASSLK